MNDADAARSEAQYLLGHVVAVRFRDDRELLEDIMDELGRDDNLGISVHRLRSRVDKLARFATLLALRGCLRQQEMLGTATWYVRHRTRRYERYG